jgi:hypothetical protein
VFEIVMEAEEELEVSPSSTVMVQVTTSPEAVVVESELLLPTTEPLLSQL